MKKEDLNKTVAKFEHKGLEYQIDLLTDVSYGMGFKEYDVFQGNTCIVHFSSKFISPKALIETAKEELRAYKD